MKKLLGSSFILFILIFFSHLMAFTQDRDRPFQVGGGLIYGSEVEELGIQANLNFPALQNIEIAPDFSLFFTDDESGIDNYWELNLNGHYFLSATDLYNVYGLGGLNITTVGDTFTEDAETEAGVNAGLGAEYYLEVASLYGEIKYVISDFDQIVLGAGIRIPF